MRARARERHRVEMIEEKVREAREVCKEVQGVQGGVWDEVEEVRRAKADLKLRQEKQDPLESFCKHNPEAE